VWRLRTLIIILLVIITRNFGKQFPSGQNRQKDSLKECVFVNSALNLQCRIVKNTLLQIVFR